ncbi:MAG: OmpA family protein [Candidatus Melainabacteria bacterium]|nr:OmpA family protein [Candidatus Melainabacteria bacterium]
MKNSRVLITLVCALACGLVTGCKNNKSSVWDDDKTAGNYKGSARSLWGNDEAEDGFFASNDEDFIGLKDDDLRSQFADGAIPQPKNSPGESGSGIPGFEGFHTPTGADAAVFKNVFFNTDDHILRGKDSTSTIERIASYLKSNEKVYLFISGHCDERGPEAYNLSLGARRANYIRSMLVQKGVDPERLHTVSYGKERPADLGHTPESWNKNRRGEFRIYKK